MARTVETPIEVTGQPRLAIPINLKSNFPGKGFFGPVVLQVEINEQYRFIAKSPFFDLNVTSPEADLVMTVEPLQTPVINQSFPAEFRLQNNSNGEAVQIKIELEFPEELRLVRGTNSKSIYSLGPNEAFKWQLSLKAREPGDLAIKAVVTHADPDGNESEPQEFLLPVEINL
jgi:hypothetical protein